MRPKKAIVRVSLPVIAVSLIAWSPPALAQRTAAERAVERERRAEAGPELEAGNVARQAEAIQTVLRKHGVTGAYEKVKALTRGEIVTKKSLAAFVDTLEIPKGERERLRKMI